MDADTAIGGPGGRFPSTHVSLIEALPRIFPMQRWFARKVRSRGWGIVVGSSLGLLFAFIAAVMDASKGKPHY
ncbi:MAG TPA: hypothetical protein VJP02_19160 [Candidatus Sulfotelmatobacter sp.]|nr:hypothetical protein [Candidatus Sulfotelmatobacter sp.]